jgi:hypothetical protein
MTRSFDCNVQHFISFSKIRCLTDIEEAANIMATKLMFKTESPN